MIGALLVDLAPRVTHADATRVRDDTVTVAVGPDGPAYAMADESDTLQVRIAAQGRVGWAGGATTAASEVIQAAIRSAEVAETAQLYPPAPAPLPRVLTRLPGASALGARQLLDLAGRLMDRLQRRGRAIEAWAERSAGSVEVGNTRGVSAAYDVSLAAVGATIRDAGAPAACHLWLSQVGPPELSDLEALVREADFRLAFAPLEEPRIGPAARIWFRPRAVRTLLAPVLARLSGIEYLSGRRAWRRLDPRLTLADDPLAPGRPGSRPISDEGVVARRVTLIAGGVARAGLLDLALATAVRLPATGAAVRRGYGRARSGFSNLVLNPGETPVDRLAAEVGAGLVVADLEPGPAPNPATGLFQVEAPWTYRIEGGEITGRVDGAVLSGDVFELLGRVVAIGTETEWIGSWQVPSIVLDGVGAVAR